jgi:hypothetical protein
MIENNTNLSDQEKNLDLVIKKIVDLNDSELIALKLDRQTIKKIQFQLKEALSGIRKFDTTILDDVDSSDQDLSDNHRQQVRAYQQRSNWLNTDMEDLEFRKHLIELNYVIYLAVSEMKSHPKSAIRELAQDPQLFDLSYLKDKR